MRKFQEMINLREPGEIIIPQSIHDQTDTDSMITIGQYRLIFPATI